jgi:hypothetical protein
MDDLEARVRRLEDRVSIGECVIRYGLAVDLRDWEMFAGVFTDPINTGYDSEGVPSGTTTRNDFVARVATALNGFTTTQHLTPNQVIEFDPDDPDRAVCISSMYAQHLLEHSPNGDYYLLRAIYTDYMRRTSKGWRIEGIDTRNRWEEGNLAAVDEAIERSKAAGTVFQ